MSTGTWGVVLAGIALAATKHLQHRQVHMLGAGSTGCPSALVHAGCHSL
jgi:hypothetical protein